MKFEDPDERWQREVMDHWPVVKAEMEAHVQEYLDTLTPEQRERFHLHAGIAKDLMINGESFIETKDGVVRVWRTAS